MHLYSTRRALYLSAAGAALLALGIAGASPACVAYGAALIAGVAVSRALTLLSVARARAAGFEMSWLLGRRAQRATRLHPQTITAELRDLCVEHSPHLTVVASPLSGTIPPSGRLTIELLVTPLRVGNHGIFGVVLETLRAPGLHTVPLGFNNPMVLEVLPRSAEITVPGAFARKRGETDPEPRRAALLGDGTEFRELREHRPGDPFKRIAWKASARRGRLLTVEKSVEENARIWLVVDASALGRAHLKAGDAVGLVLVGARHTIGLPVAHGTKQHGRLLGTLAFSMHTAHADRSDWGEEQVIARALEHARSLRPDLVPGPGDSPAAGALVLEQLLEDAPAQASEPY